MSRIVRFSPPIINTKIIIKRHSILSQINAFSKRSILFVSAPAGYGKTTAVAQWIDGKKCAWLSIDEYSSEPSCVYSGILSALSYEYCCESKLPTLAYILDALQELRNWPSALVIDDFHICADSSLARALPLIRARMPESTAFIVISRNPPPDILNEHIIKGDVKQITGLQFNNNEIISLFGRYGISVSKYNAELLQQQTEGWAAALSAVIISSTGRFNNLSNNEMLNRYLKNHVFEYRDNFDVFKKCSICDTLNPDLSAAISGQDNAWEIISSLAGKTGLVAMFNDKTCRFHALLKEFLVSELLLDKNIDKPLLYKTAAIWYKNNDDWLRALDMAVKSEDMDVMEEISYITGNAGVYHTGVDIERYVGFIEENFLSIPTHITEKYPLISGHCFLASFLSRPFSESFLWFNIRRKHLEKTSLRPLDEIYAAFFFSINPLCSSWEVPRQFEWVSKKIIEGKDNFNIITLTNNFPFFHKGQRDYTDIAPSLSEFMLAITKHMEPVLGSLFKPLRLLIEAGILYETGAFEEAESIAYESVKIAEQFPPEIGFCAYVLYTEILRVQGKKNIPEKIGDIIDRSDAEYLNANYNAYISTLYMYNGDDSAAVAWLSGAALTSDIKLYKLYQHLATARALMVTGDFIAAETLLYKLSLFLQNFRRNADYIETETLLAICKWRMKNYTDAVKIINSAIIKASELNLITPIAKEGGDVLPILQKVMNRLKYGYDLDTLHKSFVGIIFLKASVISGHTPGMFARNKLKPVKLSPRQIEVLGYLERNLSYKEISGIMGVKTATVDDHIRKLYGKLRVSDSKSAVLKAIELGFLR